MNSNIKRQKQAGIEHTIYWASIVVIALLGCGYGITLILVEATGLEEIMQCALKRFAGIPCPGCGGTRAVFYFFKGEFAKSIYYHAFAFYGIIVYGLFFVTQTLQRITHGRIQGLKYRNSYVIAGLIILLIQYILKLTVPGYII